MSVVKEALKHVDKLVIGLSNPFRIPAELDETMTKNLTAAKEFESTRAPENNPWPMWARELMISEGLTSVGVDVSKIIFVPNLANSGLDVNEAVPDKSLLTIFIVGKDEHNRAKEKQYLDEGYKVVSLPEQDFGDSGTEIRRRIRSGECWEDLVPAGTANVILKLAKIGIGIIN